METATFINQPGSYASRPCALGAGAFVWGTGAVVAFAGRLVR